jgi:hypothetical protein
VTCHQILRIAITDAIEATGGIDPDRGSFTITLNAARDLLTQAANVIAGTIIDRIGDIGRRVLDNLLPDRRLRVSPRIVKRAISKYQARGPDINRRSYKAALRQRRQRQAIQHDTQDYASRRTQRGIAAGTPRQGTGPGHRWSRPRLSARITCSARRRRPVPKRPFPYRTAARRAFSLTSLSLTVMMSIGVA